MTESDIKKLSRGDLLEIVFNQYNEIQELRRKLSATEHALNQKEIVIDHAGSIAEAALQLNGVFESAQAASQQYLENIQLLSERQERICSKLEKESRAQARLRIEEAEKYSLQLIEETKIECAEMKAKAKAESDVYWDEVSKKLDAYCKQHTGLKELLSFVLKK